MDQEKQTLLEVVVIDDSVGASQGATPYAGGFFWNLCYKKTMIHLLKVVRTSLGLCCIAAYALTNRRRQANPNNLPFLQETSNVT
jgi:hypothetical protein